jgi:threonine/homoserine/homoserine lactone efflux protein
MAPPPFFSKEDIPMSNNVRTLKIMIGMALVMLGISIGIGAITKWHPACFAAIGISAAALVFFCVSMFLTKKQEKKDKESGKNHD